MWGTCSGNCICITWVTKATLLVSSHPLSRPRESAVSSISAWLAVSIVNVHSWQCGEVEGKPSVYHQLGIRQLLPYSYANISVISHSLLTNPAQGSVDFCHRFELIPRQLQGWETSLQALQQAALPHMRLGGPVLPLTQLSAPSRTGGSSMQVPSAALRSFISWKTVRTESRDGSLTCIRNMNYSYHK